MIEDGLVGGEDPVREPVLAQELPHVLDRVELGSFCAAPGPTAGDLVLLSDPRLVSKPDLYRLAACPVRDRLQTGREGFLKDDTSASLLA